jgi:tetratricopeptide (TPR) repeat protein
MKLGDDWLLWIPVGLVLAGALALNLSPHANLLRDELRAAREAPRIEQSGPHWQQVADFEAWRSEPWEQIGLAAFQRQDWAGALENLGRARQTGTLSKKGAIALGETYFRTAALDQALMEWQRVLNLPGLEAEDYARVARLQRAMGDISGAIQTQQSWVNSPYQQPHALFELGLMLATQQPAQALQWMVEAGQQDHSLSARVEVMRLAINTAQLEKSTGYQLVMIGRGLASLEEWDLALLAFEQATQDEPNYAEAWAFLGEARHQMGQDGKSELEKALTINPKSTTALALSALYWRRQGDYDRALSALKQASDAEPKQPVWLVELGNTLAEKGDLPTALEFMQRAVAVDEQNALRWVQLARFCVANSICVRQVGLPAARQALVLAPEDPTALDTMGLVLFNLGDLVSAERFLQLAIQKENNNVPANLHLGQVYLQADRNPEALQYLKRVIQLEGQQRPLGRTAQRLIDQYFGGGS